MFLWKTEPKFEATFKSVPLHASAMGGPTKAAQTYAQDTVGAAGRLEDAWSLTQAEDALRSLEHFTRAARLAYEVTLGKEND
jgi:hypothetical protein